MCRIPTNEAVFVEFLNRLVPVRQLDEREAFARLPSLAWIPDLLVGMNLLSQQNSIWQQKELSEERRAGRGASRGARKAGRKGNLS